MAQLNDEEDKYEENKPLIDIVGASLLIAFIILLIVMVFG